MPSPSASQPLCVVIAGPNGAGKTTFARQFLSVAYGVHHFVNADLLAAGLSPLDPAAAQIRAGRLMVEEIKRLSRGRVDFAFETTLGGRAHAHLLKQLKAIGYRIEMVYLRLRDADLAVHRVAQRVRHGGHPVAEPDIRRRFHFGWENFVTLYRPLAHAWTVFENSGERPVLLEKSS